MESEGKDVQAAIDSALGPSSMGRENNILIRAFFALFSLTMLCAAAVTLIRLPKEAVFYEAAFTLLHIIMLFFLYCAILRATSRNQKKAELVTLCCIIFAGVMLRWLTLYFLRTQQVSDFNKLHLFYRYYKEHGPYLERVPVNQRDYYQRYYSTFPAWFPYMRLVMLIYDLLGERILWVHIMDMILAGGTILLIYLVLPNKKAGLMGAALYAFNPSMIFYSCVTTPDHVSAPLFVLTIFFWMKAEKYRRDWPHGKKAIPHVIGAVICCALVNWFKPLSVLFLIAFICYESAVHLYPAIRAKLSAKEFWERIVSYELVFFLAISGGLAAGDAILNVQIESMLKVNVVDSTGLYILTGAGLDENGWNGTLVDEELARLMEQYDGDYERVYSEVNKLIPEWMKNYVNHPFLLLGQKFGVAFWHELNFFAVANSGSEGRYAESVDELLNIPVTSAMLAHMRVLYLLSTICAACFVFSRRTDRMILLAGIAVFGYILVLLFGEVQGRYKSLVVPLWCVISGYTLGELLPRFRNLRKTRD